MKTKKLEATIKELQEQLLTTDRIIASLDATLKSINDLQVIMNRWNDESREALHE